MCLIGRDSELARLIERLHERRLVTLTGPGGIGKSALARAALERVGAAFPLGGVEVDLTRIDRPEAVPEAIASQLGFTDFASLMGSPGDQPALLLFDNCEHVLDAAAEAVRALLAACEMPVVLATSRSPLDLPGEVVMPLGPLATPAELADDAATTDALALLLLRARDNGVAIGPEDLAAAAELCRLLDGIPLALEIAAARLRSLSLGELVEEMRNRPHALARPRFRGKAAHRSVAELAGWSYDLLEPEDRVAFARLGVFAGPFTAEMAHAAVAADGAGGAAAKASIEATRDRLIGLSDASLVVADTTKPVTWYRLLHPVRAVARDHLEQAGELPATSSRVVDHVVRIAVGVIGEADERWETDILFRLLAHYDHLVAALRFTVENDPTPDRALTLLTVLWGVVHQAHTAEVRAIGEQALARFDTKEAALWPDACATVATCRSLLGESDAAIELAERALPHAGRSRFAPATLRRVMAHTYRGEGDLERARHWFYEAAAAARERGAMALVFELEVDGGLVTAELGEVDAGLEAIERAYREAVEAGASLNAIWACAVRGAALTRAGRAGGVEVLEEALAECRALGYPAGESFCLRALALAQLDRGEEVEAARSLAALFDAFMRRGGLNDLPMALDVSAELLQRLDHPAWIDLGATARAQVLPTLGSRRRAEIGDAAVAAGGVVLGLREAFVTCREALRSILAEAGEGHATGETRAAGEAGAQSAELARGVAPGAAGAPSADRHAGGEAADVERAALVAEGDVWRIDFGGRRVRVKDSKGMGDLATLLAEPRRGFSCLDLMGALAEAGDHGELLDPAARRAYEARATDLHEELDEAEAMNDPGRVERARAELDALVDELTRAAGLGGRARRAGGDVERARSAVTQRLRALLKRLDSLHPELGAHLRRAVVTGSVCSYEPDDDMVWNVRR